MPDRFEQVVDTQKAEIGAAEQQLDQRWTDYRAKAASFYGDAEHEALKNVEELQRAQAQPVPELQHVELPKFENKPPIDPQEFQQLSYALLAMSLIGGAASKGNWRATADVLNGAIQGYVEGKQSVYKRELENYQRQFALAKEKEAQAIKEFDNAITKRNIPINDVIQASKLVAIKNGWQAESLALEHKDIERAQAQLASRKLSLEKIEAQHSGAMDKQEQQAKLRAESAMRSVGPGLDENGKWLVEGAARGGNFDLLRLSASRFGQKMAVPMLNEMGKTMREEGGSPTDINVAKAELTALTSALRQTQTRRVAVERLTETVKNMEGYVERLAKQTVPTGAPFINKPINEVRTALGSEKVKELDTAIRAMTRQYIEAVTMPGSNAQMHASSQEMADQILNSNLSVGQILAVFRAVNTEINATSKSLNSIVLKTDDELRSLGMTTLIPSRRGPLQVAQDVSAPGSTPTAPDAQKRFASEAAGDARMKGATLGQQTPQGWEVMRDGKLIGYWH